MAEETKRGLGRVALAVIAGTVVILLGDWLLGVELEEFKGIHTFSGAWVLDLLLVPFAAGIAVSAVMRSRMGKWLAYLPPLFARCGTLAYLLSAAGGKAIHFNIYYWAAMLLMVAEFGNLGGFLGDFMFGNYRRGTHRPAPRSAPKPASEESR